VIFFLVWPCHALDSETSINEKPAYNKMGRYDKAIFDYTEAIKRKPEHADFYYSRGLAYNKMGRYDKAIFDYTEAIKRKPEHADFYYSRGLAYNKMGKSDKAISDYTKAIELKHKRQ
jgi:tetratricopeptide (TPR) repeat protein